MQGLVTAASQRPVAIVRYSYLSASIGLTRVARRAGMWPAASDRPTHGGAHVAAEVELGAREQDEPARVVHGQLAQQHLVDER